ncbi:MAG: hypothetical protein JKY49_03280 [Cohaesibacteraceae bacterium]|nr:hypothetical protein [Cohaesibacteraceae bacterium]MBL4874889.1 hypothetical protein [Cohaesibacteraceae bacterium]
MRRQSLPKQREATPALKSIGHRIDPFALPMTIDLTKGRHSVALKATLYVDHTRVILKKALPVSGISARFVLPIENFEGICVRFETSDDLSETCASVELKHPDPDLSVVLVVTDDFADASVDWRCWGRKTGLPLLMENMGEVIRVDQRLGMLEVQQVKPRRRYGEFARRRPRFLVRRKSGVMCKTPREQGREIIARS